MAHTPTQQQQQPDQIVQHNPSSSISGSGSKTSSNQQQQPPPPQSSIQDSTSSGGNQNFTKSRPERSSIRKLSSSGNSSPSSLAVLQQRAAQHQPSKVFLSKCRAELELLLDSIKGTYHDQIKELHSCDSLQADLFVQIGDQFKRPLHRCILAARAYKLYCVLKAFKLDEEAVEQDIIVSEFQNKQDRDKVAAGSADQLEQTEESRKSEENEKTREALAPFCCSLPEDLISPELLLSFTRRIYLDTDLKDDESKLQRQLIDWLKLNRPELIKPPPVVKHSPDHRESFRTIQPDFQEMSLASNNRSPSTMSPDHKHHSRSNTNTSGSDDQASGGGGDEAPASSFTRDESLTGSLLTRTETFDLIPKSDRRSATPTNTTTIYSSQEDDAGDSTAASDVSSPSTKASAYTPTTRTGLKPKTFTTPSDAKQRLARAAASKAAAAAAAAGTAAKKAPEEPKVKTAQQPPVTPAVRTSINRQSFKGSDGATSKGTSKTATPTAKTPGKPALQIARAHPISMERSQSPATTNLIKTSAAASTTKNFIAANKRLVAQMDKRPSASPIDPNATTNDCDSETEAAGSDISWRAFEQPLSCDNMAAQLDKFALVSLSALADCLSKIFIGEILADSVVLVRDGKQINAHKCILAARSAYLNDYITQQQQKHHQISPNAPEPLASSTQQLLKIDLTEFSHNAVYFALMHIYSGIVKVPDDLDLEELTKLSHTLHVSTLKQVCQHNLRMNYCHFFHKPCQVCCLGVLKALPLAWRYDYTEMYTKCLQWIGSHFANIFCLKEFSELKPSDLIEECYSATLSQLTPDNIIPRTIECQKLLKNLPRVKWTETIICLVGRLLEDFCHYVADNYEKILQSESFLNLGKNCWECEVLEENLLAAMNHLKPDSGCKTLIQLHKIECSIECYSEDPKNVSDSFAHLISKMRKYCERYLLKEATAVVHCSSWRQVNPALQKRIRDQAILSTDFDEPVKQLAAKPKLASMSRNPNQSTGSGDDSAKSPSNRSTPDSRLKSPSTTYLPPPKNKVAAARHLKVLK